MQTPDYLSRCVLGTAGLGGIWGKIDREESIRTILMALENGIASIDTAPAYGDAEELVGIALRRWQGPMPIISTKAGRLKSYAANEGVYDYSSEGMEKSVVNSLQALGVPAIDILFLHDPSAIPHDEIESVLAQLTKFKKGYTKRIGVGVNEREQFMKYTTGETFDVIMEFNCLDACNWDAFDTSFPFYQSNVLELYIGSPLHMGLLGNRFEQYVVSPPAWLDIDSIERAKLVKQIADKHHLQLHSLAHRFLLSVRKNFKIVIGPSDTYQLRETIADIRQGPLPGDIFEEIMNLKRL